MLRTYNNLKVNFVGDPHLGKKFRSGVPLNKLGLRELAQMQQYRNELMTPCDICIVVGDLFDKYIVDNAVILESFNYLMEAASQNPKTDFFVIMGNHDTSKRADTYSSFDIFSVLSDGALPNVAVLSDPEVIESNKGGQFFGVVPYSSHDTRECVQDMIEAMHDMQINHLEFVVGHWEIQSFGGDDHNLCPYDLLCNITREIVTGHIHQPEVFYISPALKYQRIPEDCLDDMPTKTTVVVVGSMQPYSHSEDVNGVLYVTVTRDEYMENPSIYENKCVRIIMEKGEELPDMSNVLQVTTQYKDQKPIEQVKLEKFDMKELFNLSMKEEGITEESQLSEIWGYYTSCLKD